MSLFPTTLLISGGLLALSCTVQFFGLIGLSWVLHRRLSHHAHSMLKLSSQGGTIIAIVMGLFMLHAVQIWIYALTYFALGQIDTLEAALYFSASSFTTVGYGDITLSENWRLMAAAESANGFLMIGWSTAFLVSVTSRMHILEADIERAEHERH